jgi:hypothetical protein
MLSYLTFIVVNYAMSISRTPADVTKYLISRNDFARNVISSALCIQVFDPRPAYSSNLPSSNGADLTKTGTVEKLVPILKLEDSLVKAQTILKTEIVDSSSTISLSALDRVSTVLNEVPTNEKAFKRLFDEYSDPVSYKQKYMDQNAFLVYYTKGFDGPNRPPIESGEAEKQTLQYGARNECWNAFEELQAEIQFGIKNGSAERNDILGPLLSAISSVDSYLSLSPENSLEQAKLRFYK